MAHVVVSGAWDHRPVKSDDVAKIAAAVGPVVVAFVGAAVAGAGTRNRRSQLKTDAEVLMLLPENSDARRLMESHIEGSITRMAEDDEKRRDPMGSVLALLFLGFAGWTWTLALDGSNWWVAPAIFFTTFGFVGLGSDAFRAKRDERGRRIRPPT